MKSNHTPQINSRYWALIVLASTFGTNLGDLYAHDSGLGIFSGLVLLAALFGLACFFERRDDKSHQLYYWFAILVIRTGATNIADFMARPNGLHIDRLLLSGTLAMLLACLAWIAYARAKAEAEYSNDANVQLTPVVNAHYWLNMLVAGTFGTVFGDFCSHALTQGQAAVLLGSALALVFYFGRKGLLSTILYYWFAIAMVRSLGTAVGDWIAENAHFNLGLTIGTACTGAAFMMTLLIWRELSALPQNGKSIS